MRFVYFNLMPRIEGTVANRRHDLRPSRERFLVNLRQVAGRVFVVRSRE